VPKFVPTVSVIRSASYPTFAADASQKATITTGLNGRNRAYRQQLKAASTELLNDDRVETRSKAGRSLQNVLMETESRLREQRRASLRMKGFKQAAPFLLH
jgi:hypothetical protein